MAKVVLPYATAKKLGRSTMDIDAGTVQDLLDRLQGILYRHDTALPRPATVLVNGVAVSRLKGTRTPLSESDMVWFVLPAGGG